MTVCLAYKRKVEIFKFGKCRGVTLKTKADYEALQWASCLVSSSPEKKQIRKRDVLGCWLYPSLCFFFFYLSTSSLQERKKLSTSLAIRGINASEQSVLYSLKVNYSTHSPMSQTTPLILYLLKSLPIGQLLSEGSVEPQESLRNVPGCPQ